MKCLWCPEKEAVVLWLCESCADLERRSHAMEMDMIRQDIVAMMDKYIMRDKA